MNVGVIDAGIVIGWLQGRRRSFPKLDRLFDASRGGRVALAEVLVHTADLSRSSGIDPIAVLRAWGVRVHSPDETVARRVAKLGTSLADGFAAATAQELGARLHTTDTELVRQVRRSRLPVTHY